MKKALVYTLVILVAITMFAGCKGKDQSVAKGTEAEKIYRIKGGHANPADHPYHIGLEKFAELLKEKSGGRILLDSFHSSQLGNERDLVEGLQLNTVQAAVITSAPLSGFTDAYLVFDLPFVFEDVEEARKVCDSPIGQQMLASLEDDGVIGLTFFENGMRNITNSKRPIETPADLRGIKIRTMENMMHMDAFRVMGADPTPMAFGELFTAMQQKAIDAQENPYVVIYANKFFEVQDYLSITEHLYSPAPLLISKTFYDSLPNDLQQVMIEAAREAKVYQWQACDDQTSYLLKSLEEAGMIVNRPDKAPFVEATKSLYDKYVGVGKGLVDPETVAAVQKLLQ
ncbi:MAG: TRAP transporter substrate-binding protein [Sphaerochaeta sp.]|jgi:tripartite ATP-independent transporter DctP family solute receptor